MSGDRRLTVAREGIRCYHFPSNSGWHLCLCLLCGHKPTSQILFPDRLVYGHICSNVPSVKWKHSLVWKISIGVLRKYHVNCTFLPQVLSELNVNMNFNYIDVCRGFYGAFPEGPAVPLLSVFLSLEGCVGDF